MVSRIGIQAPASGRKQQIAGKKIGRTVYRDWRILLPMTMNNVIKAIPPPGRVPDGKRPGWTAVEVVAVLIVIGILTVYALLRYTPAENELIVAADKLKSNLRYAQYMAMSGNGTVSWGIRFPDATSYRFIKTETGVSSYLNLPGDTSTRHTIIKGVTISGVVGSTISFDQWGAPASGSSVTITLSKDGRSKTVTVTRNTGFVR